MRTVWGTFISKLLTFFIIIIGVVVVVFIVRKQMITFITVATQNYALKSATKRHRTIGHANLIKGQQRRTGVKL